MHWRNFSSVSLGGSRRTTTCGGITRPARRWARTRVSGSATGSFFLALMLAREWELASGTAGLF